MIIDNQNYKQKLNTNNRYIAYHEIMTNIMLEYNYI